MAYRILSLWRLHWGGDEAATPTVPSTDGECQWAQGVPARHLFLVACGPDEGGKREGCWAGGCTGWLMAIRNSQDPVLLGEGSGRCIICSDTARPLHMFG